MKMPDSTSPKQLPLDLAMKPRFGAEDFLVSSSNDAAYAMIEAWPQWPADVLLLVGPSGAGKSHLSAIWSTKSHASVVTARTLTQADPLALVRAPALLIEDIDRMGDAPELTETALFHVLNAAKAQRISILLTSRLGPDQLKLETADVRSRLRAACLQELGTPDDALLRAVIVKLFVDRQLVVDVGVVEYLALHLERSLDAVRHAVTLLDRQALALGRRITRLMAADVLKGIDGTYGEGQT
jgi:chromosomal replication initiation ATPase DnaA